METVVFHPLNLSLNDCSVQGFPASKHRRTVDIDDNHSIPEWLRSTLSQDNLSAVYSGWKLPHSRLTLQAVDGSTTSLVGLFLSIL